MIKKIAAKIPVSRLFLIDSLGAILTISLLLFVLIPNQKWFGMPETLLLILTVLACILFGFSLLCFLFKPKNWRPFMSAIAGANLSYAALTLIFAINNFREITFLGWAYFVGEVLILVALAMIEINKSKVASDDE